MSYRLFWEIQDLVLCLELGTQITIEEFVEIDEQINAHLDRRENRRQIILKIDALETSRIPQNLSMMKSSQTYVDRPDLKSLIVIGGNKYVRLIMMLTFNLSRPTLHFAMSHEHAKRFLGNIPIEN